MKSRPANRKKHINTTRLNQSDEGIPQQRLGMRMGRHTLGRLSNEDSPWYESGEEVADKLETGKKNKETINDLRKIMHESLTKTEAQVIELRYFEDLNLREIATLLYRNPSTILRNLRRAIAKLRKTIEARE